MKLSEYPAPEGQQNSLEFARESLKEINKKAGWRDNYALVYADSTLSRKCVGDACMGQLTYGVHVNGGNPRLGQPKEDNPITYMLYQTIFDKDDLKEVEISKELMEQWVTFLLHDSIYKHAFVEGNPKNFLEEGFIIDARYPFDYIYQACAAVRYLGDISKNVVMWKKLVDLEVDPNKAFILAHFLREYEGGVIGSNAVEYEGHSAVCHDPTLSSVKNFLKGSMASGPEVGMTKLISKHQYAFNAWGVKGRFVGVSLNWPAGKEEKEDCWKNKYFRYAPITWEQLKESLPEIMKGFFSGKA